MSEWMVKLGAAAAITAACALAGRALCQKEQRRVSMLQAFIRALPQLRLSMLERLTPLEAALRESGCPLFAHIAGNMADGMSACEGWQRCREELTAQGAMLDCLLPEDLQRLDVLFESLGGTGKSGQQLLLDSAESGLLELLGKANARAEERGKLYTNLGLLLGLAIAICLL